MLTLTYHSQTTVPVEAECIRPDHLAGRSPNEIAQLPVQHGNRSVPLGEFFNVSGDAADELVRVQGDCSRVKWLGAGMTRGRLIIEGHAGMHVGAEMEGGELIVEGNAGDWAGAEMRGGRIHIRGHAGHLVGAGYRGSRHGTKGGVILVNGNAGNEIGGTMRRGLIVIGGDAGDFAGVSMIAGTVMVLGQPGIRTGAGLKRGSVILLGPPDKLQLLPTFRYDCTYQPQFLRLYLKQLMAWGFPIPAGALEGSFRRYSGDLVALGKGEILQRVCDQ